VTAVRETNPQNSSDGEEDCNPEVLTPKVTLGTPTTSEKGDFKMCSRSLRSTEPMTKSKETDAGVICLFPTRWNVAKRLVAALVNQVSSAQQYSITGHRE
jgi:hypothetical protein